LTSEELLAFVVGVCAGSGVGVQKTYARRTPNGISFQIWVGRCGSMSPSQSLIYCLLAA